MPHGSCANCNGAQPRMAQLLTMFPYDGESTFKTINAVKEEAKRDWGGVLPSNRHIADADEAAQLEWERSRRVTMWRLGLDVSDVMCTRSMRAGLPRPRSAPRGLAGLATWPRRRRRC